MDLNSRMTFGDDESYVVDSFVPITPGKTFPGTSNSSRVSMNGQSNRENWGELSGFLNPNCNPAMEKFGEIEQLGFNNGHLVEKNRVVNQLAGAYSQSLQSESVGWNGTFLSLLEMTNDIHSNESPNLHSLEPNSSQFLLANQAHSSDLGILAGIPQYGFPVPYNPQFDLNAIPSTEIYSPSTVTNSFQFEPVTPNEKWMNGMANQQYISAENVTDVSICGVSSRNQVDTSSAIISVLSEEPKDAVVSRPIEEPKDSCVLSDEIIDLNKTPQQKAQKRRKHRPKVIVEGKAKRTPKAADTENKKSEKKPKEKRKYVRKDLKQSAAENADDNGVKAYATTTTAKPSCKKALNFDSEIVISGTKNNPLNKEVETSKLSTSFQVADLTNPAYIICRRESSLQKSQQNKQMPETSEAISNLVPSINLMAANSASNLGGKAGFSDISASNRMATDLNASTRDTIFKNQQFLSSDMTGQMIFHFNPYSRFPPYYDGSRSSKREYHQIMQGNGTHHHHGQKMSHTNSYSLNGSIRNEVSSETRKKKKTENGNTANIDGSSPYASAVDHSRSSNVNSLAFALQRNSEALNGVREFNRFPVHSSTRSVVSGQDKSKQNMTGSRSLREILYGSPASVNTIVACNMVPPTPVASSRHKDTVLHNNSMNLITRQEIISLKSKGDKIHQPEMQVFNNAQSPGNRKAKPKFPVTVEDIIYQMESLNLNGTQCNEKNALVPYRGDGTLIPFEGTVKKRKPRPKVELDAETERVWKLLMWKEGSEDQGTDEEKRKWWDEERRVFRGRADSFIARMHLVQGDRRFSKWKGSVVDSVIGVFLTQNVSDHLSSSAFMSLASRFPPKPATERTCQRDGTIVLVEEPDLGLPNLNEVLQEKLLRHPFYTNSSVTPHGLEEYQLESETSCTERRGRLKGCSHSPEEVLSSQDSFDSSISQSNGLRLCSGSNSEAEEPTNGDKCNKNHRTCSADLLAESTTSFAEFYSNISGKSLFLGESGNEQRLQQVPTVPSNNMSNSRVIAVERLNFNREESISSTSGSTRYQETPLVGSYRGQAHDMNTSFHLESQSTNEPVNFVHEQANKQCASNIAKLTGKSVDGESQIRLMGIQQKPSENNLVESGSNDRVTNEINSNVKNIKARKDKGKANDEKKDMVDWDSLRKQVLANSERKEKSKDAMDSLDYEAMRSASVNQISDTIRERGMNNMLAERIKEFLDRLVRDHGSVDLEWLRDVPPDKAKEYLLSIRGLGLKSVECVRLLTLHHLAFPVDTNVGRIAVRLGWVPLQPLPESLQLHLLELYPILESIQKYLWPRLCKLDQRTLYELHYQMITFGKVFCTKSKPNCNACPMRAECRHFASAFASARLALPGPEEKSIVNHTAPLTTDSGPGIIIDPLPLPSPVDTKLQRVGTEVVGCVPIIEEPSTPEQQQIELIESDIEDLFNDDGDEIPTIKLNMEELSVNLQNYMESNMDLQEFDMSKALVALNPSAASIPTPKLKNISRLRTEHSVYELPDSHPLLNGMDKREPDDPSPYLLAIWTPGETAESIQPPGKNCQSQEPNKLCNEETCFSCNSVREANSQIVRGTILIPCRTAMRGSFPLNGTYFQVNEMFADHASSLNPIDVPRAWIWNLPRRMVYFGTSVSTIFKGLSTEQIQYCFWRGFVCVRGFDQISRAPRPLLARFHFPASKLAKAKNVP